MALRAHPLEVRNSSFDASISLSEVISALSFALDLTEGAIPGHALRSCLLGMRIAAASRLPADQLPSLYYALLLKDVGCSSNSARMCQIVGGDDRAVKAGVKLEDWTKPHQPKLSTLRLLWNTVLPGGSAVERVLRIGKIAATQHSNNKEMITLRCDRGASILTKLDMGSLASGAVHSLDEHWNGSGYPFGERGAAIPLLARICAIAQHLDVFATERGTQTAIDVLQERSGTWFDPELVRLAASLHASDALWQQCAGPDGVAAIDATRAAVLDLDPGSDRRMEAARVDLICEAFADVVDAKSPFTYRHSIAAADAAQTIALGMGLPPERVQLVRRAALLHDIGKLRVPNSILDKQGNLSAEERVVVEEHPGLTRRILERVGAFQDLALVAGQHHERLDGTGYPDRIAARDLCLESRIIAVADVYSALSEKRPYREQLGLNDVSKIMESMVPGKLDPDCTVALIAAVSGWTAPSPAEHLTGLLPSGYAVVEPNLLAETGVITAQHVHA